MHAPVVILNTADIREDSIEKMKVELQENVASAPPDSVASRCSAMLLAVMPEFFRALDHERKLFALRMRARYGRATVDEYLQVMARPLANMMTATVATITQCRHNDEVEPCQRCMEMRLQVFACLLNNIHDEVRADLTEPVHEPTLQ